MKVDLPAEVAKALAEFLAGERTGPFILDVKDGRVQGWRLRAEEGRVPRRPPKYAMQ